MTVAVTGATGFVGRALLDEAIHEGVAVRALARREQPQADRVEWVHGDLADQEALRRLVKNAEAVIHVAGVVNTPDPAGFHAGNVEGTLRLVEAAAGAGVPRFIFVSSLAAREPELSVYGASKRKAEKIVSASGLDWTIVRPPAIYGPRDREMLELFRAAKWGIIPMPPAGRASIIHVVDLVQLLLGIVPGGEDLMHRIFEPDDGKPGGWNHRELALAIGEAVGRRPYVPHLSEAALRTVARLDGLLRRGKAKLTPDRVGYMAHPDWVCDPAKAVQPVYWSPRIETRGGLKVTASWYRQQGWL